MTPNPYEYIAVMCFSLLGVLIAVVMLIDLMKKPQKRKEEEKRKKYLNALFGRGRFNHKDRKDKSTL